MHLNPMDVAVVVGYIVIVFSIALSANLFMKKHFLLKRPEGQRAIENHYLAGKSITFWEALLSIIATEFSAMAFLTIPSYVYFDNLSYLRFIIGACISRALIAFYFLPRVYGRGMTIFEVLARGVHGYADISKKSLFGKKVFASFYILTKIIGVGIKLLGGAILISEFFNTSLFLAIVIIALMTYLYIMLGGLKAVVRTDMMQAGVFIFGGLAAHYIIGKMSSFTWGELMEFGIKNGKFDFFPEGGSLVFLYGILAGVAYDAATHGVDQDLTQKLFGAKNIKIAQKALAWSALGSLLVNLLFLFLGVLLWSYYTLHGQTVPAIEKIFSFLITHHFPSPMKGLMVASVLAACMSTLDSSINALSACFWNDVMRVEHSRLFRVYINMDNFIITLSIILVAYVFSLAPGLMKYGLYFSYLSTAPLLGFFLCRMLLSKYIKINYSALVILLNIACCFLGMALNYFRFGFNPQLTILWGIITAICFMWIYSKVSDFLSLSKES